MEYSKDEVDDMVLALLYLRTFKAEDGLRAWKSQDWGVMERLYGKGCIGDPKTMSTSVVWTEEGHRRAEQLFRERFAAEHESDAAAR